jgi:hypothetical protein
MDDDHLHIARAAIRDQLQRLAAVSDADLRPTLAAAGYLLLYADTDSTGISTFCIRSPDGIDFVYTDEHRKAA